MVYNNKEKSIGMDYGKNKLMKEYRCEKCKRLLFKYEGELQPNIEVKCKCKKINNTKNFAIKNK